MNTTEKEYRTINGFTRPKHPFQIFTIVFFIEIMCCVSIAIVPITNLLVQIILACFFYFFSIMIFYYAFKTSYIDPTDDYIIKSRRGQSFENEIELYDFFCSYCDSYVSSTTKHCRVCERCVSDFDHHCKWLNNCIGKKNYREFFKLLIFVSLFGITFVIFGMFSISFQSPKMFIWILVNVGLVAILFLLNFNLMFFHFWLKYQGVTTYAFIIQKRQKKSQEVPVETPQKFCCSTKKTRVAQVNPKQDFTQGDEQVGKNEVIQNEPPTDVKQQNVEIEGDAESVPDNPQKRKNSSHTINSQINNQIQE
ncbi:unnamed protein product (macronuclear) [Paramecium tetraurelia]|uniref:Palmitoyltransferase n=1 Tax=Paramecium tetraurelia TaxID=5888 RepID=A0C4S4_PARTE|nr:uncharacterized protein GSPATT00006290001 [Paramecium tetraurelia]CAK65791.1 unnamed protein product [Paramecium tetraurelia]|eukprot:XP_001433188.1 hypothetical protein (macronuclear) [Paramecium tetraurelia strain d4-2]